MPDIVSLVNTGGVQPNTLLDSQHRQAGMAGISFALCVCKVCESLQERETERGKERQTERER